MKAGVPKTPGHMSFGKISVYAGAPNMINFLGQCDMLNHHQRGVVVLSLVVALWLCCVAAVLHVSAIAHLASQTPSGFGGPLF